MPDLEERLRQALSDRYAVESEIGRGAMATVFVADDLKHGRKVAIKVLHPDLAAVVGTDRFLREIQLSAQLEHPNILTLIDSGEADGLPYFVMPLVEGESLRDRLEREGRIPPGEAVAIGAEVADALDYAHRRGVIHRDVKPANVLLSEGHARVADFGVAYAVDEAGGERTTATGLAVGSPAYMSPEQGAGEEADARSDLYSLGCVLYELLAGEPPFIGDSARALMSKHALETAPRLDRRLDDVPEDLADAVEKCLAKAPEDRFETGAELRDALLAGGVPALPGVTRNLGVLAGVSAVALAAVLFVVFRDGLSYWLLGAAGALLVVQAWFFAGAMKDRRALARGEAIGGWRRLRARLTGALAGVAGLAALGVGSATTVTLGAAGVGPLATLVSRGILHEDPLIVVADFESPSDDPEIGPNLAMALRIDLGLGEAFEVVDEEGMRTVLRAMRREPDAPVDREAALEIAERAGAEAILIGGVRRIGAGYTIEARLLGVPSEELLWEERESASGVGDLIDATGRLSRRLQRILGEPLRKVRNRLPLADQTTGSLEALKMFGEGARAWNRGEDEEAIERLQEAVTLDPEFAHAWSLLNVFLGWAGRHREAAEAERHWCELSGKLPPGRTASRIEFACNMDDRSVEEKRSFLRDMRERYPPWGFGPIEVDFLMKQQDFEEAAKLAAEQLELFQQESARLEAAGAPPRNRATNIYRGNLANSLLALHRFGEAQALMPTVWGAFAARDYDLAEVLLDSMRVRQGDDFGAWESYAQLAMAEGRLSDFEHYVDFIADSVGQPVSAAFWGVDLAWYRADATAVADRLERAVAEASLDEWGERPLLRLVRNWVIAGQPDRAREVLQLLQRRFPDADVGYPYLYGTARADLEVAEGRPLAAVEHYRKAFPSRRPEDHGWDTFFRIGRSFDAAGLADSAIVAYERAVAYPGWRSNEYEYYTLALSTERLAELYDARGDTAAAVENYRLLTELWEEADPELQPRVEHARRRVAELSTGSP